MFKILFVCHGNICRSPMAEFIMKDKVSKLNVSKLFEIDSRAVSTEEIGNQIHYGTINELKKHGILDAKHFAKQITYSDYKYFDYIFVMDNYNLKLLKHVINIDNDRKVSLIGDFISKGTEIEDPWYTNNFCLVYDQLSIAIDNLTSFLLDKKE